jgi:SAM-dependent methyltransferase
LTLYDDIKNNLHGGFDAVICLGNSFAHMPDNYGDQREQKQAIRNFEKCLRPGGLLLIDHRNYDSICNGGSAPSKSIYYNVSQTFHFSSANSTLNLKRLSYRLHTNCSIFAFDRLLYFSLSLSLSLSLSRRANT